MGLIMKNRIAYAGSPSEIDAKTVNGHTVESDVPVDAKFTDNSDITAEGGVVSFNDLQGGVPFSEIVINNSNGTETTIFVSGKNCLPVTLEDGKTASGVTANVSEDKSITVSGTTTGLATFAIATPNMPITTDMRLSCVGDIVGMSPKAAIIRNGEKVYPTLSSAGSKVLAGDVIESVYLQQQNADVVVSGTGKFQLESGTTVTEYEAYQGLNYTFTPDSDSYVILDDVIQKDGINTLIVKGAEGITLSVTGVRKNAAVAKLWNKPSYDDTEICAGVDKKLDKNGSADSLKYSQINFNEFATSINGIQVGDDNRKGEVLENPITQESIGSLLFLKEIEGITYAGGEHGFGYFNDDMSTFTPIVSQKTEQLMISDIGIAQKNPSGEIIRWVLASSQRVPYFYEVDDGILTQYTIDNSQLGYTFFPTVIYSRPSMGNPYNYTVFFIDVNMSKKIGYVHADNSFIQMNFNLADLSSNLTDICIIQNEDIDICFITTENGGIFNDMNTDMYWEDFNNYFISGVTPWSDTGAVRKIYYDKDSEYVYLFVITDNTLGIYSSTIYDLLDLEARNLIYESPEHAETLVPRYEVFGYNDKCYILENSTIIQFMRGDSGNKGVFEDISASYENPISFCSHWVYNKNQNAFYFCSGNGGDPRLFKLAYDRSEKSVNVTLNQLLTLISQYEERIALLEELQGI